MRRAPWTAGRRPPPATAQRGLIAGAAVLRGHLGVFSASVGFALLQHVSLVAATGIGAYLVGNVLAGEPPEAWRAWVGVLAVCVVLRTAALWCEAWISHDLAFRLLADIRVWVYRAIERIAPGGLGRRRTADVASTAMADAERLELLYAHALINAIVGTVVPIATLTVLATFHPHLALALLPFLVAVPAVGLLLQRRAAGDGRQLSERLAGVQTQVHDALQGFREVVGAGRQVAFRDRIDDASTSLVHVQQRHAARGGIATGAQAALTGLAMLAVLAAGAALLRDGRLGVTLLPVAVVLTGATFVPVAAALNNLRELGTMRAAARRVFDLLDAPPPVPDTGDREHLDAAPDVVVHGVGFRYDVDEPPVLRDVAFTVGNGETVALVGHSGAGKSTLAALLLRHRDVDAGAITVGGVDVRDLRLGTLRELVSYVPQDTFLFHDTIAANLRLAAPRATDADLEAALRQVGAWSMVEALPAGLETIVGDRGARLSGGQRQRLALARASLRDAPILVLDEAVSHLDLLSERDLKRAVDATRSGRTTLVIAHRLSTILTADRIVVLEGGRVVDDGSHRELVARCTSYRDLVGDQLAPTHLTPAPAATPGCGSGPS